MKTIYVLGYNNLGADFWESHLTFNEENRVLFFRNGTSMLKHLQHQPDLIIVDDYFCEEPPEDHNFADVKIGLGIMASHIPTFFFSPKFSGKARKSLKMKHYYSSLDSSMLEFLNKRIVDLSIEKVAA